MSFSPMFQKLALTVALACLLWDISPFMGLYHILLFPTALLASNGGLLIVLDQRKFEEAFQFSHLQLDVALCALAIFGYFRREKFYFLPYVIVKAIIVVVSVISFIIAAIMCILDSDRVKFLEWKEISKVWLFLAMLFGILCNFLLGSAMLFGYLRFSDDKVAAAPERANANFCHEAYTVVSSPHGKTYQVGEA